MPVCPTCKSLGIGDTCAHCGADMRRPAATDMSSVSVPGLDLGGDAQAAVEPALGRERQAAVYLQLQPSEQAVLHAASRILASFIASGTLTKDNERELCDRSVHLAARMAIVVERYVQSDDEDW